MSINFLLLAGLICSAAHAVEPMTFKTWKEQQIIESQNRLARVSNRVLLLKTQQIKSDQLSKEMGADLKAGDRSAIDSKRIQKLGPEQLQDLLERDREQAAKAVEFSKGLTLEDYWLVYLAQFQDSSEALSAVAEKMSKEEIAHLLKAVLKNSTRVPVSFGSLGIAPGNG